MKQTYYVGLNVSKDTTAICVRCADGVGERVCETATEPEAICTALTSLRGGLEPVVLETGRMANWPHGELTGPRPSSDLRGRPSGACRS